MKIALAQISMSKDMNINLKKSLEYCDRAKDSDLLFFPEIQLSPFFPQYEKQNVDEYCLKIESEEVKLLANKAREHNYYFSPNIYLEENNNRYDASLWIEPDGNIKDISKMVHISQAEKFYEQDYYTSSNTKAEPLEMFEWEMRVQAMQNQVFIAMCNRVGKEDGMDFAGESLVINPNGDVVAKAGDEEQLLVSEIDLNESVKRQKEVPYLSTKRKEWYK